MSIPGAVNPLLLGGGDQQYEIQRSLRFNGSADSAYLSRVFPSAGNRQSWTWAGWVKRSSLTGTTVRQVLFSGRTADSDTGFLEFGFNATTPAGTADTFYCTIWTIYSESAAVFRDVSAWYHIVVSYNGANIKAYVNNVEILSWARTGDLGINSSAKHTIGANAMVTPARYFNGYLADIHFIDGQALDPTSFGEFDDNNVWQPKAYTGTYGTNGFHLPFSDNSTAAALGTDTSGNSNNWTVNNLSVAAGAGNDSLVDTPTSYGTDTGAGGEVRGNYATCNPLESPQLGTCPLFNGNLQAGEASSSSVSTRTTIFASAGKWYAEFVVSNGTIGSYPNGFARIGVSRQDAIRANTDGDGVISYGPNGSELFVNTTTNTWNSGGLSSYTQGDVLMVAFDAESRKVWLGKNGSWFNFSGSGANPATGSNPVGTLSGTAPITFQVRPQWCIINCNFGQRPFAYTAPSGFKALCTTNLPEPTIADGSTAMDVVLDTGANILTAAQGAIGGSADLLWIKDRANTNNHQLIDTVRGGTATLQSNTTAAETTYSAPSGSSVAWTWDAGSSTVTNTQGSITSQVRANPSAGFSVVTYTGTGANATVGHGLNVAPEMIIFKRRNSTGSWSVYHKTYSPTQGMRLESTAAAYTDSTLYNNTAATSSVMSVGITSAVNSSSGTYVAYCFAPVAGYSAFGSCTGNGSADGPFIYLGFRPKFFLYKRTDSATDWWIVDAARNVYNVANSVLFPNLSNAEITTNFFDFTSNGVKVRDRTDSNTNASGGTYIYAAFAENPFQYARAR